MNELNIEPYVPSHKNRRAAFTEEFIDDMCEKFLRIANQELTLGLLQCIAAVGISQRHFYELREKWPQIDEAFEKARTIIGARREFLALKGRINPLMVIRMAGFYDDEYRKIQQEARQTGEDDLYQLLKRLNTKRGRMDDNQRRVEARREARDIARVTQEEAQEKADAQQLRFDI